MSTDSELKSAAERLIKTIDDNLKKWVSWFPDGRSGVDVPRDDLLALKHYAEIGLAQRADDGELVDAAFLESLGFIKCFTSRANPALDVHGFEDWTITFDSGDGVDLRIYNDRELTTDCWINNAGLSAAPQTRGQLRQLLSALGVNTGGGAG